MSRRTERVAHMIQRDLGTIILQELRDPRLGFVTVVRVDLSPDLRQAKVFISIMGSAAVKKSTLISLKNATGFMRNRMGAMMQMRRVPELYFVVDKSVDYSMEIQERIAAIESESRHACREKNP